MISSRWTTPASIAGLAWLLCSGAAAQDKPLALTRADVPGAEGNYAIVVGIDDYKSPDIVDLSFAESDASSVAAALVECCGYTSDHVLLLLGEHASLANILQAVDRLSNSRLFPGAQTILLYFSGHGANLDGENYLIPVDGTADAALAKRLNIPLEEIEQAFSHSAFQRKVLLVDACRNVLTSNAKGGAALSFADMAFKLTGMKALFATEFGQLSREDPQLQHGVFTYYVVEGLRGGAAEDGVITFGGLERYVSQRMLSYCQQHLGMEQLPVSRGEGQAEMPIAVVPAGLVEQPATPPAQGITAPTAHDGIQAPDFALDDTLGVRHTLADLLSGKRLLVMHFWCFDLKARL